MFKKQLRKPEGFRSAGSALVMARLLKRMGFKEKNRKLVQQGQNLEAAVMGQDQDEGPDSPSNVRSPAEHSAEK